MSNNSILKAPDKRQKGDDTMDEEFDKIFHPEKFETSAIPTAQGKVDQERQKYYRSSSIDEGGDTVYHVEDQEQLARKENAKRTAIHEDEGHSKQEFAHNHPIMTKLKSHGKHRKTSDSGDSVKKKQGHRKPSQKADLTDIQEHKEDYQERTNYEEDGSPEEESEEKSDLPWKQSHQEAPETSGSYSVFSSLEGGYVGPGIDEEEEEKKKDGVKFTLGPVDEDDDDEGKERRKSHHKGHRRSSKREEIDMDMRRRQGSELKMDVDHDHRQEDEDDGTLLEGDLDNIDSRRFEKPKGMMKHKIEPEHKKGFSGLHIPQLSGPKAFSKSVSGYGYRDELDHTPHELFVEMDELEGEEWVERARWIKYEEDLEAELGRWGKPHVASLSFHSLISLRKCLESGTMLLDISARDLPQIFHRVVEDLSEKGIIMEEQKAKVLRVLLYRHKHVQPHQSTFKFGMKRSMSQRSIQGLLSDDNRKGSDRKISHPLTKETHNVHDMENGTKQDQDNLVEKNGGGNPHGPIKRTNTQGSFKTSESYDNLMKARKQDILSCMEDGTEGSIVLVGALDDIDHPITAFVRLGEAIVMPNTIEVGLPVRFIFILLTPKADLDMDHHEIGRSFSTLMSNPAFHNVCYRAHETRELLHAINEFLDDSIVLPPGDWDKKSMLPMNEMMAMRKKAKERKEGHKNVESGPVMAGSDNQPFGGGKSGAGDGDGGEDWDQKRNPLARTGIPFGGLIDDIKYRHLKSYFDDLKDGLNAQCVAATIFIYFAALSGAIAFGGIMASKTGNLIGISETMIMSAICGVIFGLFSGCPLIIIGTTGPVLLYDEALFEFCKENLPNQFLAWRTWIGIWTFVISLIVAGFQGSTVVKYFTKFTKDIFNSLVSLLFIFEAIKKLVNIFKSHPMKSNIGYCEHIKDSVCYVSLSNDSMMDDLDGSQPNTTLLSTMMPVHLDPDIPQPNTALLSFILMFGTFFIAHFLKGFRNSHFLGRTVRRALGDFGVPIAIVLMVLIDSSFNDTFTEKLSVPRGIQVTNSTARGWLISPTGTSEHPLAIWAMFGAIAPAILLYMLLFMETHICELIMMEKTREEKGAGLHLDIVLLSLINLICGLFGGPWICAATVRAVAHVSALTVMSTTHVPGESVKLVGVRDQRVTATTVSILLGLSVAMAPALELVPFAVLFGVFLYMGVSGMNGVQFFDRLTLFVKPVKHHPHVTYVTRVQTWRMILFTTLQLAGLVLLWVVKSTAAALAFPFFVMLMIPYRFALKYIFSESELEALDGASAGKPLAGEEDDEEKDFFETANDCPITPATQAPLHRSLMAITSIVTMMPTGNVENGKDQNSKKT